MSLYELLANFECKHHDDFMGFDGVILFYLLLAAWGKSIKERGSCVTETFGDQRKETVF